MRRAFLLRPSGRPGEYFVENPFYRQPFSLAGRPVPIGEAFAAADPGRSHAYTEPYARRPELAHFVDVQRLEDDYKTVAREEDRLAERYLEEARRESERARLAAERVFAELRAGRPEKTGATENNNFWTGQEAGGRKEQEPDKPNRNSERIRIPEPGERNSFAPRQDDDRRANYTNSTAPPQPSAPIQSRLADLFAERPPERLFVRDDAPVNRIGENLQRPPKNDAPPAAERPSANAFSQRPQTAPAAPAVPQTQRTQNNAASFARTLAAPSSPDHAQHLAKNFNDELLRLRHAEFRT